VPATAISFHMWPADYASDFRPAAQPRFILVTKGVAEVLAGGGEVRTFALVTFWKRLIA
jgi:hypothetical protein|tara:strand:+ start:5955 stop:6131 length:177 start_codon:yes stop_codon:yes gene_type:complete